MKGKGENRRGRDAGEGEEREALVFPPPEAEGLGWVPPTGRKPGSIWGEGEGKEGAKAGAAAVFRPPCGHLPQMEPAAVISRGQIAPIRRERQGVDALHMAFEDA
jgi:hypothetical protein